jgi:hypothetical protein
VLAQARARGREEQGGAVQRALVAFDHADHQVDGMLARDASEPIDRLTRDIDRGLPVASEPFSPFRCAGAHRGTEGQPARIARLFGELTRRAARHRVSVPACEVIYALLRPWEIAQA